MEFRKFNALMQKHIEAMAKEQEYLFMVDLDSDTVWNTYLDSFPDGANEIFRERREHDCSCCRHFVRDFGRVVAIRGGEVVTIWDFDAQSEKYQPVVDALSRLVKSRPIVNVFIPTTRSIGTEKNREVGLSGDVHTWYHFYTPIPFSLKRFRKEEFGTVQGRLRDIRNVFQRSLEEISADAVDTVLELIAQKSLYKGDEWRGVLEQFRKLQRVYLDIQEEGNRDLYCWETSVKVGPVIGKIRNHSIGVLLTDISEGVELDMAVTRYEKVVAPSNYKRPKAIFTKKMVQRAQETVKELGFGDSLARRYAQLEDITVPNTLFANRNASKVMSGDVFEELASEASERPKNLSKVEEIDIETFVKEVIPKVSEIEILLENSHASNMVSLVAPKNAESKTMFKWNNNFSWAYSGNITDSMKERVKAAGGRVDGVLRFSIQWNDNDDNHDDLDAHCLEPKGNLIYFQNKGHIHSSSGMLDVDIIDPGHKVAVENITWGDKGRMPQGTYQLVVHCYSSRGAMSGFSAEIEFDGQIYSFEYAKPLRQSEKIEVARVFFDGEQFSIKEGLKSQYSSKEIWGLPSNKFHPVTIAMLSPNYWDEQKGIGHKHYFFMLDKCVNPESPNGFFNEFLKEELMEHKKVFEALGSKMRVEDSEAQLSGLGFSSTKRAHVVCKVKGNFERMLKIKF